MRMFSGLKNEGGQSLIEILIGLAIGMILIGSASVGISVVLRGRVNIQESQTASTLGQELMNKTRSLADSNWHNIYNLTKGSSTEYSIYASGTVLSIINSRESILKDDITDGLVGHWKLDEGTSTIAYDFSGLGNNGTLINNPTWIAGKISNALSFDGSSQYITAGSSTITGTSPFTLSTWLNVKTHATYGLALYMGAASAGQSAWIGYSGAVQVGTSSSIGGGFYGRNYGSGIAVNSGWHLVTLTFSGGGNGTAKLYVDGVEKVSDTYTPNLQSTSIMMGKANSGTQYWYNGDIDDARIYNRALSATEIKQIYGTSFFTRYFSIENVCRSNDAQSAIVGVAPCGDGTNDDPSTQLVTVYTKWPAIGASGEVKVLDYLARRSNFVLRQTDWSGGDGEIGPLIEPNNKFASSSNTNFSGAGSIKIEGL